MQHRPFGRTGIQVSEIAFGGGSVGGIIIYQDDATKREAIAEIYRRVDRSVCVTCRARIFEECRKLAEDASH